MSTISLSLTITDLPVYTRSTKLALHEGNKTPLLDIVAYAGYAFTGLRLAVLGRIIVSYSYYFLMSWTCLCMGIVLVKTKKRVLFSEVRSFDSSRHHYLLLFIVLAQFPLFIWLGNITTINGESTIFIQKNVLQEVSYLCLVIFTLYMHFEY
ncbi:putative Yif1 family protein [Helianthus annuus]|nr:putative Yif1 family protein [Helianthus annuus]KAJ0761660.1 putative Yif1 family protein [Helianthus annuus]